MSVKDGTSAAVLRLPKGGGAITAISEGFKPDLRSGTGNYTIPIEIPEGRAQYPVVLQLTYSTGFGNGSFGFGWSLSGIPAIQRRVDNGIPSYTDTDRLELASNGELASVGSDRYRSLIEGEFSVIHKRDNSFEMRDRQGQLFRFGETIESRVFDPDDPQRIFRWLLSSIQDPNGNRCEFKYRRDEEVRPHLEGPANQVYLSEVLMNNLPNGSFLYHVILEYDFDGPGQQRPDPVLSNRAGFPLETNWRCRSIEVQLGQDTAETHTFDTLLDGSAVTSFQNVQPNSFEAWGFTVNPMPPLSPSNLALFTSGLGAQSPFLGFAIGHGLAIGEMELLLSTPAQRVSLSFYGENATYTLRAYDDLDRLIARSQVDAVMFGGTQEISIESIEAPIYRLEFGSQTGAIGIAEIQLVYQSAPVFRRYELSYDDSGDAWLSLLKSIQLFGENPEGNMISRPPIRFGYSISDDDNRVLKPIVGAPSVSLASDYYEIVDLVGTGTPDILYTAGGNDHKYFLNRGAAQMAARADMPTAPSATLANLHTRLGDIKGLISADLFTNDHVYPSPSINHSRVLNDPVEWGRQESLTGFPAFTQDQLPEVRFFDLTGDGSVDILRTGDRFYMWFRHPDNSFAVQPPIDRIYSYLDEAWPNVNFSDPRIKIADMTGDGFMDIVRVDSLTARVEYWSNKGLGIWGRKQLMFFDGSGLSYPLNVQRLFFADIDNNGFSDLLYVDSGQVFFWPNQGGKTFGPRQRITNTPTVGSLDAVRLLDMTGSGTLGILWTRDGSAGENTYQFMNLTGEVKPNLLSRVENGTGGVTDIEYASSSALYHEDERAGRAWDATAPFAVHVVSKITKTDTIMGVKEEISYQYRNSYFDREKRLFQGFEQVTILYNGDATPSQEVRGAVEVHHFHQQILAGLSDSEKALARALAGREYLVEFFDKDRTTLLKWARTDWKVVSVYRWQGGAPVASEIDRDGTPVLYPYVSGQIEGIEEGTRELKLRYESEVRSVQNTVGGGPPEIAASHGQILERHLYGEVMLRPTGDTTSATVTRMHRDGSEIEVVDVPQDSRLVTRTYAINETSNHIRIASEVTCDASDTIIAENHYFYDGIDYEGLPTGLIEHGNLSRQSDLVLREDFLATIYAGSAFNADWAAMGYVMQPLSDGSANGFYVHSLRFRYGEFGLPTGMLSPLGSETVLSYDGYITKLEQATNPLGHTVTATYDYRVGMQTTYTDENDHIWQHIYDGLGRLVKEIEPGDSQSLPTRYYEYRDYEAFFLGRPVAVIKHERETQGGSSVFTTYQYYDSFLRDLQTRKPWRSQQGWPASPLPQPIPSINEYQVTSRKYNPRGGMAQETLPYIDSGHSYRPPHIGVPIRRFTYDAMMRTTRVTNPDGTKRIVERKLPWVNTVFDEEDTCKGSPHHDTPSSYYFNAREHIEQVDRNMAGRTLSYIFEYDLMGNMIKATDPASNEVHRLFDTRGLQLRLVHPDAGTILHYYNAAGKEVARVYSNGDLVKFTYDELNRINTRQLGGNFPGNITFTYDTGEGASLIGRLSEVRDSAGNIVFSYDERGREDMQKRTFSIKPEQSYTTRLKYDPMGRIRAIIYPDESTTIYRYGTNGKVEKIDGLVHGILYHQSGRLSQVKYPNGFVQIIDYESNTHRVSHREVRSKEIVHHDLAYTYDKVGNIVKITDNCVTPGHLMMSRVYVYDDLYRLKRFTSDQGHDELYAYDDIGNMTLHTGYSAKQLVYPAAGQTSTLLGAQGDSPWQYDTAGKLIVGAGFDELRWDAAQRLVWAREANGTTNEYLYSPNGDLLQLIRTSSDGTTETAKIVNEHFAVYQNHTLRRVYVDDKLVAVIRCEDNNETVKYSMTNEVSNVIGMLGEAGDFNQIEYAPYGKRLHETTAGTRYGFCSKEEVASDLLSYDVRQLYTPVGRWIQPDPLIISGNDEISANPEMLNVYAYANNNPIHFNDPTGLAAWESTRSWNDVVPGKGITFREDFHNWIEANHEKHNKQASLCNWYPIKLLVNYAEMHNLRIKLRYWPGNKKIGSDRFVWQTGKVLEIDSDSDNFNNKGQYIRAARSKVTSEELARLNTVSITLSEAKAGDMIQYQVSTRYWHSQVITEQPNAGKAKVESGSVPAVSPAEHQSTLNLQDKKDELRRWDFAQFD